jgi:hypothetical protein
VNEVSFSKKIQKILTAWTLFGLVAVIVLLVFGYLLFVVKIFG